jgi:hypothetical protein
MQFVHFWYLGNPFCSHNPLADIGLRSVALRQLRNRVDREEDILERGSRQLQKG